MLDITALGAFITASLALLLVPGPAVLYVIARCIEQGQLAGIVSVLGVNVGVIAHIFGAAFGLSALLMTSATAFAIVKYLGAGYLIYLGIRTLMSTRVTTETHFKERIPLRRIFTQGIIVTVLNPKLALFFFAFLPQFADVSRGSLAPQILLLGLMFMGMALVTDGIYALIAGRLGDWLKGNDRFWRRQRYFSGGTYVVLGVATAISGSDSSVSE